MNGFAEVAFVQRARPKTQAGAPPSGIVENVPCNGFAFPAGVGRDYDFSGLFNQPGNDVELGGFVAGRCVLELLRQNWEMCEIPLLICRIIVVCQEVLEKMRDCQCDDNGSGELDMPSGLISRTPSLSHLTDDDRFFTN